MTVFRQAWRNLWRNSRRTSITMGAVVVSTSVMIFTSALTIGMVDDMIGSITRTSIGEVQVHSAKYLADRSLYRTVNRPATIILASQKAGAQAAPRSYGFGLVSCRMKSAGAMFWGVDPETEKKAFDLAANLAGGKYLAARPARGIVLGSRLAKSLEAKVGSEIVALVQAADGSLGNEMFRVTGILASVGDAVDRNAAIIHRGDWAELFAAEGMVHEVAITSRGKLSLAVLEGAVKSASRRQDVRSWRQLVPMASDMLGMVDVMLLIFSVVFGCAAGLGVMNTMLMATHERTREFGVLKALGTTPRQIVRDVSIEAAMLGLIGAAMGILIGAVAGWYTQVHGIDTSALASGGLNVSGLRMDPVWHARLTAKTVVVPPLIMWVMCVLSALYPAVRAARLDPVKAMAHV